MFDTITTPTTPLALATRETTVVWVRVGRFEHPLVTLACSACSKAVDVCADESAWFISRVNGDSRYGYEPSHRACYPPVAACSSTTPEPHEQGEFPMDCYACHMHADA